MRKNMFIAGAFLLFVNALVAQNWNQIGSTLTAEAFNDYLGGAVSISDDGTTLIAGASLNSGGGSLAGHARIYRWNGTNWVQKGSDIDGQFAQDQSGWSVSMDGSGNTVAIGSPYNSEFGSYSGQVRVYQWNGTAWVQKGTDIHGSSYCESGSSVSINQAGDIVAIGSPGTASATGAVNVYSWNGSAWIQMGSTLSGEAIDDYFGRYSVSLSDNGFRVASGGFMNDGNGNLSGYTRVYEWNGSSWNQLGADIDGLLAYEQGGYAVSLSGDGTKVAIGSPYKDIMGNSDAGAAKVYLWNGSSWILQGLEITGLNAGDFVGGSVQLDASGSTLVVGSQSADLGFPDNGAVTAYTWDGANWVLKGTTLTGSAVNAFFGKSVAVSADGTILAAGAPYVANSGEARVYCYPSYTQLAFNDCAAVTSPSGAMTWTTSGLYHDTLQSVFGCDSILVCSVTIGNTMNSFTETVCDTIYYPPSGAMGWTASGVYTDVIPNTAGCDSIMTFHLTFVQIDTSITISNGIYTVAQSGGTYQWRDCISGLDLAGETSQSFIPSADGTYAVVISLAGCSDTSECRIIEHVGLSEYDPIRIHLTPNPAQNEMLIESNSEFVRIEVFDFSGRKVLDQSCSETISTKLLVGQLANGRYTVRIQHENGLQTTHTFLKY